VGGATLLECRTYRTRAHAEGMGDFTYRTRDEVEAWKKRCPIQYLRQGLLKERTATATELDALEVEVQRLVEDAQAAAENGPWPDPGTATTHVYAEPRTVETKPPTASRELSFMQATLEALGEEMARNPTIFVLGEGIGQRGGNFKT